MSAFPFAANARALFLLLSSPAAFAGSLPDPRITPGATNPEVTQENIERTICVPGWTKAVRPPVGYTLNLKAEQILQYGYSDRRNSSYEEDHLIPLDLGGHPTDPRNLWPEPLDPPDGWGTERKDELEYRLNRLVCSGRLPLADAQVLIARNWIDAYQRYVEGW
jgi:hypothetical protein